MENKTISILQDISAIFPFNPKRGELSFSSVEKILSIRSMFPNLDTYSSIKLSSRFEFGKYEPSNIVKLSDIESKGFKVDSALKESGLALSEYSPFLNKTKNEVFFNIGSSNLPNRLSRSYMIKNFKIDEQFLNDCIYSYRKNTGLDFKYSKNNKISLDFKANTVYFPKHEDKKLQLSSLIRAMATARIVGNENTYNAVLKDQALANKLKTNIVLVENAIFSSYGLKINDNCFNGIYKGVNTADFRKNYIWGNSNESVLRKINDLSNVIKDIVLKGNFESSFITSFAHQEDLKKQNFTNSKIATDNTELFQALNDERSRIVDDINNLVSIDEVIRDFGNVDVRKKGSGLVSLCIAPDHQDSKPSLSISPEKNVCHCFSCGYSGNIFKVVQTLKNVDYYESVNLIAEKYNITTNYDFIKEQFKKTDTKEAYLSSVLNKYKHHIDHFEYEKILNMDLNKLKEYDYTKKLEIEKEEEYKLREKPKYEEKVKKTNSYVFKTTNINENKNAVEYLQKSRGFSRVPDELCLFTGKHEYENNIGTYSLVGFINEKKGADGKFFEGYNLGKPRSFGNKDLTILNKQNLEKSNPNFIVVESQWDLVAFYNNDECKKVYDESVAVILNGTTNVSRAINYINDKKSRYSGLYILGQGDAPNARAMQEIHFGCSITRASKFNFLDNEVENKKDINDLLKDGVDLSSRINLSMSQDMISTDYSL